MNKKKYFKVEEVKPGENWSGDNWLICFGRDAKTNCEYYVTTDMVRASEFGEISWSAKDDAEYIAEKLNERAWINSDSGTGKILYNLDDITDEVFNLLNCYEIDGSEIRNGMAYIGSEEAKSLTEEIADIIRRKNIKYRKYANNQI